MDILIGNCIPSQWTTSSNSAATPDVQVCGTYVTLLIDYNGAVRPSPEDMTHSESGAHGGLVQPIVLYQRVFTVLQLEYQCTCVMWMWWKERHSIPGLLQDAWQLVGGYSSSDWPQGHVCWWTRQMMAAQVACDLGLHYWSVCPREAGMEAGPKNEGRRDPHNSVRVLPRA